MKYGIFLFIICFVIIALAELGLQVLDYPYYEPEVRVGWRYQGADSEDHLNQLGFRGRRIMYDSTDKVVLLLGDSQVEADGCAFDQMPERYLEQELSRIDPKIKVFSIGAGGYGTDQALLALEAYFKQFRADLVLLWVTPSNDVWNNLFPTHIPKDGLPKPTFWLEKGQLKGHKFTPDSLVAQNSPLKLVHLWQRIFANPLRGIDEQWATQTMPPPYQPQTTYEGDYLDWTGHKIENLHNEKAHAAIQLLPTSPRTRYGIALTQALFERVRQMAEKHGIKVVFFYRDEYPELPTDTTVTIIKQGKGYFTLSKKEYNQNIELLMRPVNAIQVPLLEEDWRISPNDGHLNAHANAQVMKTLVDSLGNRPALFGY